MKDHLFMDYLHIEKNMGSKLGAAKGSGLNLYERAVYAPSKSVVDAVINPYSPAQA